MRATNEHDSCNLPELPSLSVIGSFLKEQLTLTSLTYSLLFVVNNEFCTPRSLCVVGYQDNIERKSDTLTIFLAEDQYKLANGINCPKKEQALMVSSEH